MSRGVGDYAHVSDVFRGTPFGEILAARTPEDRKAEGQQRALDHAADWKDEAVACIREWLLTLPDGALITADDWRDVVPVEPPHFNAWGALAGKLARWGWLTFANDYRPSRQPQGNANTLRVWRVCRRAVERGLPEKERAA
jgi:hypothetical protein